MCRHILCTHRRRFNTATTGCSASAKGHYTAIPEKEIEMLTESLVVVEKLETVRAM
jgi:hypothetical protein